MLQNVGTNYQTTRCHISEVCFLHDGCTAVQLCLLSIAAMSYLQIKLHHVPNISLKHASKTRLIQIPSARWYVVGAVFWSLISCFTCFKHGSSVIEAVEIFRLIYSCLLPSHSRCLLCANLLF